MPIEPELNELLLKAFAEAEEGVTVVIPKKALTRINLWRDFGVICKRAGLPRWSRWCQVLRRNRENDWAREYPQYVVSTWVGHDISVSARHYLQVREEHTIGWQAETILLSPLHERSEDERARSSPGPAVVTHPRLSIEVFRGSFITSTLRGISAIAQGLIQMLLGALSRQHFRGELSQNGFLASQQKRPGS